jgi:hypothetical protein
VLFVCSLALPASGERERGKGNVQAADTLKCRSRMAEKIFFSFMAFCLNERESKARPIYRLLVNIKTSFLEKFLLNNLYPGFTSAQNTSAFYSKSTKHR